MKEAKTAWGRRSAVVAILALVGTGGLATATSAADSNGTPKPSDFDFIDLKWQPWAELGGTYGKDDSSYGEVAVFAPLVQSPRNLFFTEIRGRYFEGDLIEGNAMLGTRRMTASGFNIGAWAGLDMLHTDNDNTHWQVSGGLESLSRFVDVRVNGYYPLAEAQAVDGVDVVLEGSNIFIVGGKEVALYGVDGEIGGRLPLLSNNRAILGVYGGGFWFDHEDIDEALTGGYGRIELAFNDIVSAGSQLSVHYRYSDDNVRGSQHLVGARLRIPLGRAPSASEVTPQWLRMVDRIERNVDIIIAPSGKEAVEDALTGVAFDQVVEVVGSATDTDEIGAITDANTLIIASGEFTGDQMLNPDQTLQGGGSTIKVRGVKSGALADFTAPGETPSIVGAYIALTLLSGDNHHVVGFDIDAPFSGIYAIDAAANNAVITDNFVAAANGIAIVGSGTTITNNVVSFDDTAGLDGTAIQTSGGDVTISDNVIDVTAPFYFTRGILTSGSGTTISGNQIDGGTLGVETSGTGATISSNQIQNVEDGGVVFVLNNASQVAGSGNTYTDTAGTLPTICAGPASGSLEVTVNGDLQTCP